MLVLTLREGDVIEVGENVNIMIRRVKNGVLKVCIDAPSDVPVRRLAPASADDSGEESGLAAAESPWIMPDAAAFVTTRRKRPSAG